MSGGESSGLRRLAAKSDVDAVDFRKGGGLVPVIAQDASDGSVLMLAYANREALEATLDSGEMHFWSRSRRELWRKGATSGNTLLLKELLLDCDRDAVLGLVAPAGPACHAGERTCFGELDGWGAGAETAADRGARTLVDLDRVIEARARQTPEGSYTARLLGDPNLRVKKLGEEVAELVSALARGEAERAVPEAADLIYHVLTALRAEGVGLAEVTAELRERSDPGGGLGERTGNPAEGSG